MTDTDLAATVHHSGGSYPVVAGWGLIDRLGERLLELGVKGPAYIITDENVMRPYGRNASGPSSALALPPTSSSSPPASPARPSASPSLSTSGLSD